MARLNTHVHVVELNADGSHGRSGTFGPDDTVPGWAVTAIGNPDVWEVAPEAASTPEAVSVKEPPRGGPGSSADAWRDFAAAQGLEVPDGASAKEIQAIWDDRS